MSRQLSAVTDQQQASTVDAAAKSAGALGQGPADQSFAQVKITAQPAENN
jgi:hypothetical protein